MNSRIRDLGLNPGQLPTGLNNAITDVDGVRVGHTTLIEGEGPLRPGHGPIRTGATAILPHPGNLFRDKVAAAVHTINGYGKVAGFEQVRELGSIETPILLTNTLNVGLVADGVVGYMLRDNPEIGVTTGGINPVVGECNDGFLNDIRGRHVQARHVWAAIENAQGGKVEEGNVGAGTGTAAFEFKGGIGTASRQIPSNLGGYTVGTLVQTNFGKARDLVIAGIPIGAELTVTAPPDAGDGSIMIVLATDAPCTARQLGRLARRAAFGLGRVGSLGAAGSGDFVIAFSTTNRWAQTSQDLVAKRPRLENEPEVLSALFQGVVEGVEEAVLNALVRAETMTGRDGNTRLAIPLDHLVDILNRHNLLDL